MHQVFTQAVEPYILCRGKITGDTVDVIEVPVRSCNGILGFVDELAFECNGNQLQHFKSRQNEYQPRTQHNGCTSINNSQKQHCEKYTVLLKEAVYASLRECVF